MAAAALVLIEYRTDDGIRLRLEVSPAVARALRPRRAPTRERPASAVRVRHRGEVRPLDLARLNPDRACRRVEQRHALLASPWSGPRHVFPVLLGLTAPGWNGMPCLDERGGCGICHGQRLAATVYCLACDRCGRDASLATCPANERPRVYRGEAGGLRGGCRGKR